MILTDIFFLSKCPCFCCLNLKFFVVRGKPCVFAASQLGCYNPNCGYCHDHHTEANKTRPRKSVRTYWKQETDRILSFQAVTSEILGLIGKKWLTKIQGLGGIGWDFFSGCGQGSPIAARGFPQFGRKRFIRALLGDRCIELYVSRQQAAERTVFGKCPGKGNEKSQQSGLFLDHKL